MQRRPNRRWLDLHGPRSRLGYGIAVVGTALATLVLLAVRPDVSKTNVVLSFLLVVVASAAAGGLGPGAVAAVLGFLAFDILFLPPYKTLVVSDRQDYLSLAVYLLTAFVVSYLVGALERRRVQAERREQETRTLYELSTSLVAHGSLDDTLSSVVRTVRSLFNLAGCAIALPDGNGVRIAARDGEIPADLERMLAPVTGTGIGGRLQPGQALTVPLRAGGEPVGALVVVAGGPESPSFGETERRLLVTFANQAALAVEQASQEDERARTRTLEELDRLRTALLNSVSHDLRTPLASIKASASSLLDHEVDWSEQQRDEFLVTIDEEADRLTRLVHNLLDMSRIEANALDPRVEETSLAEIAGSVVHRFRSRCSQRVDVRVPDSVPPVLADPVLLEQVVTNLLDNAIRYGCGSMIALVARELDGTVELRVIDHGPGIPEPERERVFDQFYRLKGGGKRPEGTGMGLSISRGIVVALHGHLRVETTPGGGATFVLTLPVAKGAAEIPLPATPPERDGRLVASGPAAHGPVGGSEPSGPAARGPAGGSQPSGPAAPGPAGDAGARVPGPAERKARR
jgi:two-component system, OmpR family, sensor histidine kinase KdpD